MRKLTWVACTIGLLVASSALAQNTTAGGAFSLQVGPSGPQDELAAGRPEAWYRFTTIAGRSYCVETETGWNIVFGATTPGTIDTVVDVFASDTTTLIVSNDDQPNEPFGYRLSRACFIATATQFTFIRFTRFSGTADFWFVPRVRETSLFSNWFFVGTDYQAYAILRNTTSSTVGYTVRWRDATGAVVGTVSSTLAANGGALLNARSIAGALAAVSGTVEIVHNGSPDAIMATTTVLSATTGLSFDTFFVKRSN